MRSLARIVAGEGDVVLAEATLPLRQLGWPSWSWAIWMTRRATWRR